MLLHATCTDGGAHRHGAYKSGRSSFPALHNPLLGAVFPQPIVRTVLVIVAEVFTSQPARMSCVEDDQRIQQFSAATPHPTFGSPVLPPTPIGRSNRLAAHGFDHPRYFFIELSISIQDQASG